MSDEDDYEPRTPREKKLWKEAQESLMKQLEADGQDESRPLTIVDVRKMTPEQINEHWDEVIPILEESWR